MERVRRRPFVPYKEAFEEFTRLRKEINDIVEEQPEKFEEYFKALKIAAAKENTVAMDLLAYYYKSGIEGLVPENYQRYIQWEMVSAGRGNEFAIQKLQFLISYACEKIVKDEEFGLIAYKNDINQDNILFVLGKAIAKIYVKNYCIFPVDLFELNDDYLPYKQEYFVNLRQNIDNIIPKVIAFLKS